MIEDMPQDELAEFDVTEGEFDTMLAESQPVQVTGPMRYVHFELISGPLRSYRWRLVAADGEILATSAASYRSPEDAHRAVSALADAVRDAPIVAIEDPEDSATQRKAS